MAAVYDSMASTFLKEGLNLAAITAIRQFYGELGAQPEPLYYRHYPTPLQQGAVRLVVLRPVQGDPLIQLAHSACQSVIGSLPAGIGLTSTSCICRLTFANINPEGWLQNPAVLHGMQACSHMQACPPAST